MPARRAILLCGQQRALVAAIARELSAAGARLVIQAARADAAATRRLGRSGIEFEMVAAELGGEVRSARLVAAARKASGGIDTVIVCPSVAAARGRGVGAGHVWAAGLGAALKGPAFLAKQLARRWKRSGGCLIVAIGRGSAEGARGAVFRSTLLTMVDALSRALPATVSVAAVVADPKADAAEIARGVARLVTAKRPRSGTVLEIGALPRRG
jgi:NAD(P)-dependent dehydrogenase (short-subunit alcohol dehydrogenase family)